MAKLINVYKGMTLTPEQEREMFVETFKYLDKKLNSFLTSGYFDKLYEENEEIGADVEDASTCIVQIVDYCEHGFWV